MKTIKKSLIITIGSIAAVGMLGACADGNSPAQTPIEFTQSAEPSETMTDEQEDSDSSESPQDDTNGDDSTDDSQNPPTEVTGYTQEAEEDLKDEGVSKEEVERIVKEQDATIEYDDDGHWEFEGPNDIEFDITPDGLVTDVDR